MWPVSDTQSTAVPWAKKNLHAKFAGFKTLASLALASLAKTRPCLLDLLDISPKVPNDIKIGISPLH